MGPNDAWFAECLPCQWQETYSTQDSAIHAAEEHVFANHRNIPPEIRGEKKMGHVQLRTVDIPTGSGSERYGASRLNLFDGPPSTFGAISQTPELHKVVDITTPKGEVIEVKE